jgi:HK97 family phage major capsid protein
MNPVISRKLKKLKIDQYTGQTTNQGYHFLPMTDSQLSTALGYPFYKTTQLSKTLTKGSSTDCSAVYFGNWAEMLIGQWGGLELKASSETSTAFQRNQTWIRAIQEVDVNVRHAASFSVCKDARTNE